MHKMSFYGFETVDQGDVSKFWSRVDKTPGHGPHGDCWVWSGARRDTQTYIGYGIVYFGHRVVGTHRLSWFLEHGWIPEGMNVLHTCDNRVCVNPSHLFLGTVLDNGLDMARKGRSGPTVHPERYGRGETHPRSKLSEKQVLKITRLYKTGKFTARAIGKQFGVTDVLVGLIGKGKVWKHLHAGGAA